MMYTYGRKNVICDLEGCGCKSSSMIWVSHSLKAVWFETPKTASTSIKRALNIAYQAPRKHWIENLIEKVLRKERSSVFGFEMWIGDEYEVIDRCPDYFKFAIVRNPWDKMVSNWSMFCRSGIDFRERQIEALFGKRADQISFDEFVKKSASIRNHHWQQLVEFLPRDGDGLLIDYLGRLESFQNDWKEICLHLGIEISLESENTTNHQVYRKYYNEELKTIVADTHKDDVRILKYEF